MGSRESPAWDRGSAGSLIRLRSISIYILVGNRKSLKWRSNELARVINARLAAKRPIIVEGIGLCWELEVAVGRRPDFLVRLENLGGPLPSRYEITGDYFVKVLSSRESRLPNKLDAAVISKKLSRRLKVDR